MEDLDKSIWHAVSRYAAERLRPFRRPLGLAAGAADPMKKGSLGPRAHFYIKSNLVINGAWAGQNGSKMVPKVSQDMQLLIPKVWRDLAKLDFRTPQAHQDVDLRIISRV